MGLREQKKAIQKLIKKHKVTMGLSHWTIDVAVHKHSTSECGALAISESNPVYETQFIHFFQDSFVPPSNLENIVKHELAHNLTEPFYLACLDFLNGKFRTHDTFNELRENLTEKIAKLIK